MRGLVGDDDDVGAAGQLGMRSVFAPELLDGREDDAAHIDAEVRAQILDAVGANRGSSQGAAMLGEGAEQLVVEIVAVGQHDDGRVAECRRQLKLTDEEQHRQRFA